MTYQRLLNRDAILTARIQLQPNAGHLRTLAAILAHSGDSIIWLAALLLAIWQAPAPYNALALLCLGVMLLAGLEVGILKMLFRRTRPAGDWGAIYRRTDPHSFPSGHAARGLALAVTALWYGPVWAGAILLIWGLLVGLARIALGVHYLSDVVAGFFVGLLSALAFIYAVTTYLPNFV